MVVVRHLATKVLWLHFLFLSKTIWGTDGYSFRIPVKFQRHNDMTGYYDDVQHQSEEEQKQFFKHENDTMLTTAKKRWWRKGKNEESGTKDTTINEDISNEIVAEVTTGSVASVPVHVGNVIVGTISLGNQSFEVIFDTGSSSLWVFGKRVGKARKIEMGYEPQKRSEFDHRFYDEDLSDTLKLPPTPDVFKYSYGDGCVVSGRLGTETLKVGSEVTLEDVEFGITDTFGGTVPQEILYDGILGLGYHPRRVSPFARMTEQGLGNIYSVHMSNDGRTGEIMMGGSNPKLYKGPVHFAKVVVAPAPRGGGPCSALKSKWCLQVEEIGFSSRRRADTTTGFSFDPEDATQYPYVLVDTGSSHIDLPYKLAHKISAGSAVLQKSFVFGPERLAVPCKAIKTLPTFRIKIGGHNFELTGPEYSYKFQERGKRKCGLLISPVVDEVISLGAPFFAKYYTIFRGQGSGSTGKPHRIGFALSV